jgi:hypothetical protein
MPNKTPAERWKELKKLILTEIQSIDSDTPWTETEPKWWLEMSEIERHIMDLPDSTTFWTREKKEL